MAYRTTPRMQVRKAVRRRRFLDVAIRLFGEKGFHRTTVPEVVARAGSSVGSFYMYFADKEELFAEVLRDIGERLAARLNTAAEATTDPLQQMRLAVEGLFLFLAENPREGRILLIESSGLGGALERVRREIVASHTRSVERALEGLLPASRAADRAVVARCWVGAAHEAVRHWLDHAPAARRPPLEVARQVALFNLRGVGVRPGRRPADRRRAPNGTGRRGSGRRRS